VVLGSNPSGITNKTKASAIEAFFIKYFIKHDSVAQLVEHYTFNVVVLGSNPSGITNKTKASKIEAFVFYINP
jgi:hypothetical protein